MTQINVELADELVAELRQRAEKEGLTISQYLAHLIQREVHGNWPAGFFEDVVGGWQGASCIRPSQGDFEQREAI